MFLIEEDDREAFLEGYNHCKAVDNDMSQCHNPYPPGSAKYFSWNKGWNEYWDPNWK